MTTNQVLLVRGASLAALAAALSLLAYTHQVAQFAVAEAPVLTDLRLPLYLAVGAGALVTVVLTATAWAWSSLVMNGARSSRRAVLVLGWLRAGVALLGLYIAVCTVGLSVVLDRYNFGAPGVVLAAICAEVVLVAVLVALAHQHREARTELAYAQKHGTAALAR